MEHREMTGKFESLMALGSKPGEIRCKKWAKKVSKGDERIEHVLLSACEYYGWERPIVPREPDERGIVWYMVGHNSSHQFFLGYSLDGRIWRKAYDGGYPEEGIPEDVSLKEVIGDNWGYLGHF